MAWGTRGDRLMTIHQPIVSTGYFLGRLPYHKALDTCSNMSKNSQNDKV